MRRSTRRMVALLILCLAATISCSGGSGSSGDEAQDDETSDESGGGTFVDLLGVVPDTEANRGEIYLGDWTAASEVANEDPPDDAADVIDYILEIDEATDQSFSPNVEWIQNADQSEELEDQLGFHLGQIDASIVAGEPPEHGQAFLGRFDVDRITEAIEEDPEWSDLLEVVDYNGTEYFSWDDEPEPALGEPGPRDQLGRGGNLYVSENELFWAFSADVIEGMIDAREGDEDSLADDERIVQAATKLDEIGAYSAFISESDGSEFGEPFEGSEVTVDLGSVLEPYELLATGAYADGADVVGVIVLVNEDESTAEANVELLTEIIEEGESISTRQPWSERIEIESIEAEGVLTVATLELDPSPQLLLQAVFQLDSLYATE